MLSISLANLDPNPPVAGDIVEVAVFRGKFSTSGYTISVSDIKVSGRNVKINTKLSDPTEQVTNVISYPYDIIVISKGDIKKGMTFELISDNNTLAIM